MNTLGNALLIKPDATTTAIDWPAPDPTRMVCPMFTHLGDCDSMVDIPLGTVNGHPLLMWVGGNPADLTVNPSATAVLAACGTSFTVRGNAVLTSAKGVKMAGLTDDDLALIGDFITATAAVAA